MDRVARLRLGEAKSQRPPRSPHSTSPRSPPVQCNTHVRNTEVSRRSDETEKLGGGRCTQAVNKKNAKEKSKGVPDESEVLGAMGIYRTQNVKRGEAEGLHTTYTCEGMEAAGVGCLVGCTQARLRLRREADHDHKTAYAEKVHILQVDKTDDSELDSEQDKTSTATYTTNVEAEYVLSEEAWEEIPDHILYDDPVERMENTLADAADDLDIPEHVKARKRGGRRHKGHFMKRPMALAEVIEELQHSELRENALRCLSGHLIERRETDVEFYCQAGYYLFYSCGTVSVLLQEIISVYGKLIQGDLNVRGSKRLSNVLTLLQCIAANGETRLPFVRAGLPNYLLPFILSTQITDIYENLRALSLSVIGVLCQVRDIRIIKWAIESDMLEVCIFALEGGCEISKVLTMSILESILRKNEGLLAICDPSRDLLPKLINVCRDLVSVLSTAKDFSPRLLFLIVRSLLLLCQNRRSLALLTNQFPTHLEDSSFDDLSNECRQFSFIRHQLLLYTGKAKDYLPPESSPTSKESSPSSASTSPWDTSSHTRVACDTDATNSS